MKKVLNNFLAIKRECVCSNLFKRSLYQYNFDSDEEVIENYLGNIMMIGINLPVRKNLLTETAVEKLCGSIQKFNVDNDVTVAILHGCGGNFCTGLDETEKALEKGQQLIMELSKSTKPTIASLTGYTVNFGFLLATMCDLKAMDVTALAGLHLNYERPDLSPLVYKKFMQTVGRTNALEMILTNCSWTASKAQETGFINRVVDCGTALGQAVTWAQSITLRPLKTIIKERSNVEKCFELK